MNKRGLVNGIATVAVAATAVGAAVAIAGVLPGEPAPLASTTVQADSTTAMAEGPAIPSAQPPQSAPSSAAAATAVQPAPGSGFNAVIPASLGGDDDDDDDEYGDDHDDDLDNDHHGDRHEDDD